MVYQSVSVQKVKLTNNKQKRIEQIMAVAELIEDEQEQLLVITGLLVASILKMYKNGFTVEQIANATDKDVEEISSIIENKEPTLA